MTTIDREAAIALKTIAEWPITGDDNMDAFNMRQVAIAALRALPDSPEPEQRELTDEEICTAFDGKWPGPICYPLRIRAVIAADRELRHYSPELVPYVLDEGEQQVLAKALRRSVKVIEDNPSTSLSAAPPAVEQARGSKMTHLEECLKALRYYASGDHLYVGGDSEFESVSGEPPNLLNDQHGNMVEDGSIARLTLQGKYINWTSDEGELPTIVEGEIFAALEAPATGAPVVQGDAVWNEAIEAAEQSITKTPSEIKLLAGEMTAQEARTVYAMMNWAKTTIAALKRPQEPSRASSAVPGVEAWAVFSPDGSLVNFRHSMDSTEDAAWRMHVQYYFAASSEFCIDSDIEDEKEKGYTCRQVRISEIAAPTPERDPASAPSDSPGACGEAQGFEVSR